MSYEANLSSHYAAVRHRLRYGRELPLPPEPVEEVPVVVLCSPYVQPEDAAPIDMLQPPSWRFLLRIASLRHNIPENYILSESRRRTVALARQDAIGLVYQHTQMSMPRIGKLFQRDHTTVLHALVKFGREGKLVDTRPAITAPYLPKAPAKPKSVPVPAAKPVSAPRKPTVLQKAVARAYKHNVPPSVVADEYGCNPKSVKVIAHHLGIKRSDFNGKSKTDWVARGRVVMAAAQ